MDYKEITNNESINTLISMTSDEKNPYRDMIFSFLEELKRNYGGENEDYKKVLDILSDIKYEINHARHFPQGLDTFLIQNQILPIFFDQTKNFLESDKFFYGLKIMDEFVALSVKDNLKFHIFLYENQYLSLLFDIRENVYSDLISTYLHLVANFAFCNKNVRNEILIRFSPDFLETFFMSGEVSIIQNASFFIWRMTCYSISDVESFESFIPWFLRFFSRIHTALDFASLRYWLFSHENLIEEFHANDLFEIQYPSIVLNFIQNRNQRFIENEQNKFYKDEKEAFEDMEFNKREIDELLEIFLKLAKFLIGSDPSLVEDGLILQLFAIAHENWKICSPFALETIRFYISKSKNTSIFQNMENIKELMDLFANSDYHLKSEIINLLHEIVFMGNNPNSTAIGTIVLPFLFDTIEQVADLDLIRNILSLYSRFLLLGEVQNGASPNFFTEMFLENNGFDFLYNYKFKLDNIGLTEAEKNTFFNVVGMIDEILEFFPEDIREAE